MLISSDPPVIQPLQGEYEILAHLVPRGKRPVMRAKESQRSQPNLQTLDPNASLVLQR